MSCDNVRVCAIQSGAGTNDIDQNIKANLELLDKAAEQKPDFVVFSELFTTPYFCGMHDFKYFEWADTIPGKTTEIFQKKAKEYNMYIILPIFEKTPYNEYYNSAAIVGPEGLVPGSLPDGREVASYRKVHVPDCYDYDQNTGKIGRRNDEKFYFKPGQGFPVFRTKKANIGILICYDKRFTEAWRILAIQGAQIIFNPMATWGNERNSYYQYELKIMALYNQVFVVGCGKTGIEVAEIKRVFGAGSHIFDPFGRVVGSQYAVDGQILVRDIDLSLVHKAQTITPVYRDRKPALYKVIAEK